MLVGRARRGDARRGMLVVGCSSWVTLVGICNPDALNIRIFNPIKRIANAYIQCGRIANPPELPELLVTTSALICE